MELEKTLFVLMEMEQDGGESNTLLYSLPPDIDQNYEILELKSPFELNAPNHQLLPTYAANDRFLFVIGGSDQDHVHEEDKRRRFYSDVYVMDVLNLDKGWIKCPNLLLARGEPYALTIGNTLCVLGGSRFFNAHPYGEVMDLNSDEFKMLRTVWKCGVSPPPTILAHGVVYYEDHDDDLDDPDIEVVGEFSFVNSQEFGEEEVVVSLDFSDCLFYVYERGNCHRFPKELYVLGKDDSLYCYRFLTADWVVVEENFGVLDEFSVTSKPAGACENDVMYILSTTLMAYSLIRHQWFSGAISGFQNYPDAMPRFDGNELSGSCLVNLGNGVLCVLWTSVSTTLLMNLYCTKFTIDVEENDEGQLSGVANVKFHGVYSLPKARLLDCVAVSPFSEVKFPLMEQHCENKKVPSC